LGESEASGMPQRDQPAASPPLAAAGRYSRLLIGAVYLVCGAAFISDVTRSNTLAYGIFYIPLITTALFHKRRTGIWVLTGVACLMVLIGAFAPTIDPDLPDLIGNRILSILAILATAAFVHHARTTQDRLAAQARRIEAAEQIRNEVFINLSQEMRTPLHALLGLLSLMMAGCRPDQKQALGRVRAGGKQLLATIDNLIDLTQIDERTLRPQNVDLAAVLRDAADTARDAAEERAVTIELPPPGDDVVAIADPWAVRRIIDNLIANAIRSARPSGSVSVVIGVDGGVVTASVSDNGALASSNDDDAGLSAEATVLPATGGAGLTLSERLALAMNGRLTVAERSGFGATARLSLPAARSEPIA